MTLADATAWRRPSRRPASARAEAAHVAFDTHHPPERALLDDCVHCGFCLTTCPTYVLWGEEMDTPRGRILLMDLAERGRARPVAGDGAPLGLVPRLHGVRDVVPLRRALRPADRGHAPAGRAAVRAARPAERRRATRCSRCCRTPRRLTALGAPLVAYRASGLQRARARARACTPCCPVALRQAEALAPTLTVRSVASARPSPHRAHGPAAAEGRAAPRLCAAGVLRRRQRHDRRRARGLRLRGARAPRPGLLRRPRAARRPRGVGGRARAAADRERWRRRAPIASPSTAPGCGSTIKEYGHLLADDPEWADRAAARRGEGARRLRDPGASSVRRAGALHELPMRLAYHDACHLAHAQGVRDAAARGAARDPGRRAGRDRRAGGVLRQRRHLQPRRAAAAADLGQRKAGNVRDAEPDALAAANPGCLIQIGAHLSRRRRPRGADVPPRRAAGGVAGRRGGARRAGAPAPAAGLARPPPLAEHRSAAAGSSNSTSRDTSSHASISARRRSSAGADHVDGGAAQRAAGTADRRRRRRAMIAAAARTGSPAACRSGARAARASVARSRRSPRWPRRAPSSAPPTPCGRRPARRPSRARRTARSRRPATARAPRPRACSRAYEAQSGAGPRRPPCWRSARCGRSAGGACAAGRRACTARAPKTLTSNCGARRPRRPAPRWPPAGRSRRC